MTNLHVPHCPIPPERKSLTEFWSLLSDKALPDTVLALFPGQAWQPALLAALQTAEAITILDWKASRSEVLAAIPHNLDPLNSDEDTLFEHLQAAGKQLQADGLYLLMFGPPMDSIAFCILPEAEIRRAYHLCLALDLQPTTHQPPKQDLPPAEHGGYRDAGQVVDHAWRLAFALRNGPTFKFSRERPAASVLAPIQRHLERVDPYRKRLRALDARSHPTGLEHAIIDIGDSLEGAKLLWALRRAIGAMRQTLHAYGERYSARAPFASLSTYPYARNYTLYAHHLRGPKSMKYQKVTIASYQPLPPTADEVMNMPERIQYFDLSNGRLQGVPAGVCDLANLEVLILDRNNIKNPPRNLAALKSLRILAVRVTALTPAKVAKIGSTLPNCEIYGP